MFLLVMAGGATVVVQRRVLLQQFDREVHQELRQEVEEIRDLATGRDPATGRPFDGDLVAVFNTFLDRNIPAEGEVLVTFIDGELFRVTPTPPWAAPYEVHNDPLLVARWATLAVEEQGEASTPAGALRFVAVPLPDTGGTPGVFVVANLVLAEQEEISRAVRVGAAAYSAILVVAIGLAWLVAGRVLAPVRMITDAAKLSSESDLSRRIAVPAGDDELTELALTFNAMLARLDGAFRNQRAFLDDAGHELRTPITIIRGHLEVESDNAEDRRATRALVLDELDGMANIVNDLLLLARAEQPDVLRVEEVDLDIFTAELLGKATALADRDWRVVATGHGVMRGDRHRLTRAMVNLLDNAARHTPPGACIEIGSALAGDEVRLWVRDYGPGVPPEAQERIFERFARTHDGHRVAGSAGLGLAIVRAVATAHGGRAELQSRPGAGSTFTIVIPGGE